MHIWFDSCVFICGLQDSDSAAARLLDLAGLMPPRGSHLSCPTHDEWGFLYLSMLLHRFRHQGHQHRLLLRQHGAGVQHDAVILNAGDHRRLAGPEPRSDRVW